MWCFRYLGGLWVSFEFPSIKVKEAFKEHVGVMSWFSGLKP